MSDRVILAVKFTPVAAGAQLRRAVGGFLRYVQHRDLHRDQPSGRRRPEVSGLAKYVAYRDGASPRAELFGPAGTIGSPERKAFTSFVAAAVEGSRPQLFGGHDGLQHDRRRAVYRMVISPEHAAGLDLRQLTYGAVSRLERESGVKGLQWIAAVHRNTPHHHVHLVVAGMHRDDSGAFHRVDITRQRLAAMKEELTLEIEHLRAERIPAGTPLPPVAHAQAPALVASATPVLRRNESPSASPLNPQRWHGVPRHRSVIALRAVAHRYQRRMQRELEDSFRQSQLERMA